MAFQPRIPAARQARTPLVALAAIALVSCAAMETRTEPAPVESQPSPESYVYDALHWARNSAEHRAIYEQTYALAAERLEQMAKGREPGTWGISADADETLIDNSPYEVELSRRGDSFSPESWNAWVDRGEAPALPGAVAFTEHVKSLGGVVAVVTNRDESHCAPTARNLGQVGIAFDVVLCRAGGNSEKEPRWQALAKGTAGQWPGAQLQHGTAPGSVEILMWLGDNIGDFPLRNQDLRYSPEPLTEFGERFFVFPNPIYGSWEDNPRH